MREPELDKAVPLRWRQQRRLRRWVRLCLILLAAPWVAVFIVALCLDPYQDGRVWLQETHRQLGMRQCTFLEVFGLPCPSCGMTSSFTLLMHGDLWNSVQANFVGTMLAMFGLVFIPWSLASAWQGRLLFVQRLEPILLRLVVGFMIVLFGRWAVVLLLHWLWPN